MQVRRLTSLIIEPTNTCNLRCSFCFVTEGMSRGGGFMDFGLFRKIIDDTPWLEHLVLHNWGEPLLHADIFRMIDYASRKGIRHIVMNTNGTLLTETVSEQLADSPLEFLRFSIDGLPKTYARLRGIEWNSVRKKISRLQQLLFTRGAALKTGVVFTVDESTQNDIEPYIAYWSGVVDQVRLQPRLIDAPRLQPCPEPFGKDYGKLVVLWDGTVLPCCADYNAALALGNARTARVADIWRSEAMERLRDGHRTGQFPPACARCGESCVGSVPRRFVFDRSGLEIPEKCMP